MKLPDLHTLWTAPDNTRLTAKQVSMRFPVHVAARLSALCDLYPNKTRTQIVGDLLTQALAALETTIPSRPVVGEFVEELEHDGKVLHVHADDSALARYKTSANEHYLQLEKELGTEEPGDLFEPDHLAGGRRFFGITVDAESKGGE